MIETTMKQRIEKLSKGLGYVVVTDETVPTIKRSLNVYLVEKVTRKSLCSIAMTLKNQTTETFLRTFICFYLPEMIIGNGAWATAHFEPHMVIRILTSVQPDLDDDYDQAREDKIAADILNGKI